MKKSRKLALLMLPILAAYIFQATQYARAPVKYNFFVVYAKNADIALVPGLDKSPDGKTLLQNSTVPGQQGFYNLSLGQWGPGYRVNYTDAFNVTNNEAFNITMMAFNFSSDSYPPTGGNDMLKIYALNDSDGDYFGDKEVCVWNGTHTQLNSTFYLFFRGSPNYGQVPGTTSRFKIMINIPVATALGPGPGEEKIPYTGTIYMWFISE